MSLFISGARRGNAWGEEEPMSGLRLMGRPSGFTMLEVALSVGILAIGILAAMQFLGTATSQNKAASQMSIAMNLAINIQELMAAADYADPMQPDNWELEGGEILGPENATLDLDDFDGAVFGWAATPPGAPLDAGWQPISQQTSGGHSLAALSRYTQRVRVELVDPKDLKTVVKYDRGCRRITIEVWHRANGSETDSLVHTLEFLRFRDR